MFSGVTPSGSARSRSALAAISCRAHSAQPSRAAYSKGVKPPLFKSLGRGSAMTLRSHWRMTPRALTSAPRETSNLTISAWLCAAAHINADCSPQASLALMSAPASNSRPAASTLPLRATAINGVSPSGFFVLGSAPALSSASMIGAEPMIAASVSADVPNWFFNLASAPALISAWTRARSSLCAAHMIAVVPSGPGAFGLVPFSASKRKAVARSPDSAASSNVVAAGVAIEIEATGTAMSATVSVSRPTSTVRILDLRKNAAAVADGLHRNIVSIEQSLQQIGKARVLGVPQMLAALDAPVRMAKQSRWQRIVVVTIAVAHVAAKENGRVIQHRAVTLLCSLDPLDESRKHFGVVLLNLHEFVLLLRIVPVMRERMKCFGDTQVRVRAHAGFAIQGERNDARDIRHEREGHEIEHQFEMLRDVIRRADRRIRNVQRGGVLFGGHLHTALDLAYRVQVIAHNDTVTDSEAGLQPVGLFLDAVQDAAGLEENRRTFFVGVALAEQLLKHGSRVAFLRQRLCGRSPGQSRSRLRSREFERRQPRVLTDMPRYQLVGADAGVRAGEAVFPDLDAAQPRRLDVAVGLGRFGGLVSQS